MRRAFIFWYLTRGLCLKVPPPGFDATFCTMPKGHEGNCHGDWGFERRLHEATGNGIEGNPNWWEPRRDRWTPYRRENTPDAPET